jgi:YjbE family integral membrane protein
MLELLRAAGSILLVDIVLSGDNALVIGAVAAKLRGRQRQVAILTGGAGAAVLRILFAFLASFLLLLPWLQAIGGIILLFIAVRLLIDRQPEQQASSDEQTHESKTHTKEHGFFSALLTIIVADTTMSLDNVLAVGALAHGNLLALALGTLLSVALLLIGSALVAALLKRLPLLLDIAALVLAWTGANMLLNDQNLGDLLNNYAWTAIGIPAISLSIVLLADALLRVRDWRQARLS